MHQDELPCMMDGDVMNLAIESPGRQRQKARLDA